VPTNERNPTARLVRAAIAAFVVLEVGNEVRFWLQRTRHKGARWWEGVERADDHRRHQAAFVMLLTRLPGGRNRRP
jgi:hypothetical protein